MKGKKLIIPLTCLLLLCGCTNSNADSEEIPEVLLDEDSDSFDWGDLGDVDSGVDTNEIPDSLKEQIEPLEEGVSDNTPDISDIDSSKVPEDATQITKSTNINKDNYGNYYIEGEITLTGDGTIRTNDNLNGDVTIYLNGCTIYNNDSGSDADHAFKIQRDTTLVLVDNTENKIIMGESNTDNNAINASKGACLTILGNGTLEIQSYKRGIDVDGDLIISGNPTIEINSTNDCLRAGDQLPGGMIYLNGGTYKLNSTEGNGIDGSNISILNGENLEIETVDSDAIKAEIAFDDGTSLFTDEQGNYITPEFTYNDGYVYFNGAGNIKIVTSGEGDGIQADTFIYIKSGNFDITVNGGAPESVSERSSNAGESKALKAGEIDFINERGNKDSLMGIYDYVIAIAGGTFNISSDDDAIHSNGALYLYGGNISIASGDDALHAETDLIIEEGAAIGIDRSYEGLEAEVIQINGGYVSLYAKDDGINAASLTGRQSDRACQILINGGEIYVNAEGDGLDSNGEITMNGGSLYVNGPASGADAALDSEYGIEVNGGSFIALGSSGMLERPSSSSTQCCISYASSSTISGGAKISVLDKNGNLIISITSLRSFSSVTVSSPEFILGETYSIYKDTTKLIDVTLTSTVTNAGSRTGSSGPGGRP